MLVFGTQNNQDLAYWESGTLDAWSWSLDSGRLDCGQLNSRRLKGVHQNAKVCEQKVGVSHQYEHSHINFFNWAASPDITYNRFFVSFIKITVLLKDCVRYIFTSLFCMSKREDLWNKEKCFLFHFECSFRSWDNQVLNFQIFKCHDVIKCLSMKHEADFIE